MLRDPISAAHGTPFTPEQVTPADLKLKRAEQELRIAWRDGRQNVYSASALREHCPCATCRTQREEHKTQLLPILKHAPTQNVMIVNAQLVGNYAIQLFWSDGHDTGIFDFKYLRGLDDPDPPKTTRPVGQ